MRTTTIQNLKMHHSLCIPFVKVSRAREKGGLGERWESCEVAPTRNCMDVGDSRTCEVIVKGDVLFFEHHGQDSRVKLLPQVAPTVGSREANSLGSTGNAVLVLENRG